MTSARAITLQLRGTWHGTYGSCRCVAHEDRAPSLSVKDGDRGLLVFCHAGCDWRDVKDELANRGLVERSPRRARGTRAARGPDQFPKSSNKWRRGDPACRIWHSAQEMPGTIAELYLRTRALTLPPPATLRFQFLKHTPSNAVYPTMVALVQQGPTGEPLGIHRTYLRADGAAKADVDPVRMALGSISGGAVRLAPPPAAGSVLLVAEGIETALSGTQASGHPAWATLGTSGMRALELPAEVIDVTILADADDAGEAAAQFAARRWYRQGRRVRIVRPPNGAKDFNDSLMMEQRHDNDQ